MPGLSPDGYLANQFTCGYGLVAARTLRSDAQRKPFANRREILRDAIEATPHAIPWREGRDDAPGRSSARAKRESRCLGGTSQTRMSRDTMFHGTRAPSASCLQRAPPRRPPCARCGRWRTPTSICSAASRGCRRASRGRALRSLGSAVLTSEHRLTMFTRVLWFTVARPAPRSGELDSGLAAQGITQDSRRTLTVS